MSFPELRLLFELLCDHLKRGDISPTLHFEAGFGLESSQEVVMVFVFQEIVIVCRFSPQKGQTKLSHQTASQRLSDDAYLDLRNQLRAWEGNMRDLFR